MKIRTTYVILATALLAGCASADRDGLVSVSDITRETRKFMEPSGMANGLHVTSDAQGCVYFTDARDFGPEPIELPNAVYRAAPDGKVVQLATDIFRPNGIEVSPDLVRNPLAPKEDRFGLKLGGQCLQRPRLLRQTGDIVAARDSLHCTVQHSLLA